MARRVLESGNIGGTGNWSTMAIFDSVEPSLSGDTRPTLLQST